MGDDQIVISSGLVITPETVLSRSFTTAFRGCHPGEVRQFLKRVSDEMAASAGREVELRRALQEALARAAHPELDEATVTNVLGEHAARLIASARDNAASIVAEAQAQSDALLRDAEIRVSRMREEADGLMARRVGEADGAAAAIQHAAEAQAQALGDSAHAEAQALIDSATRQGKDMVSEARALRERMLGDLTRRRRSAQVQVEQLRAARERLLAAYDVVRRTVDEATAELDAAEPEARMAAEAVARRSEEADLALRPEAAVEPWPPAPPRAEPEPAMSLAASSAAPAVRETREAPVPPPALLRRLDERTPPPPDRPPLRPQTVADAVAGRTPPPVRSPAPARALSPSPAPVAPPPPLLLPPARPTPAPLSELATGEVPVVTADGPGTKVEALFARIRADREHPVDDLLDGPADDISKPGSMNGGQGPSGPRSGDQGPSGPLSGDQGPSGDHAASQVDPEAGESALEGRDDLLEGVEAGLTRALKRVLQDEQNEVLDSLRRLGAASGAVLPGLEAQEAAYRSAALPWLQQAARAGVSFASDHGAGPDTDNSTRSMEAQAGALARELVGPLRERLSRALDGEGEAVDPTVAAESLRSTYRQWKVQQVEELARHHAVEAFSVGAFEATPEITTFQWLVDEGHCPDCDDNALAGPTPKGEPFPTGQLHPPAHPGCRCLLVPVTA